MEQKEAGFSMAQLTENCCRPSFCSVKTSRSKAEPSSRSTPTKMPAALASWTSPRGPSIATSVQAFFF